MSQTLNSAQSSKLNMQTQILATQQNQQVDPYSNQLIKSGMQYLVTQTSGTGGRNYPVAQHTSEPSYKLSGQTEGDVKTPAMGGTDLMENSNCMSWTRDALQVGEIKEPDSAGLQYRSMNNGSGQQNEDP